MRLNPLLSPVLTIFLTAYRRRCNLRVIVLSEDEPEGHPATAATALASLWRMTGAANSSGSARNNSGTVRSRNGSVPSAPAGCRSAKAPDGTRPVAGRSATGPNGMNWAASNGWPAACN